MNYFLDTEFHEGFHKPFFGRTRHFIDLISIGIYCEDGRSYYVISKDFDIKAAWDSWQFDRKTGEKNHWLRENVLHPIYWDLINRDDYSQAHGLYSMRDSIHGYREFKRLINKYGKSEYEISEEVVEFVSLSNSKGFSVPNIEEGIVFYGYYPATDWVAFYSLFGTLINRPKGFPMRINDLKQMFDEKQKSRLRQSQSVNEPLILVDKEYKHVNSSNLKEDINYPKTSNEHNALVDAKWNYELYNFLQTVK